MNMKKSRQTNNKHISVIIIMAYLQNKQLSDPCKCIKYSMNSDYTNVSCYICKLENFLIENVKYGTNYVY